MIGCILLPLLHSCGSNDPGSRTLPSSQGKEYSITVVVEGAEHSDPHVKALKDALRAPYPMTGLSSEPYFSLRWVEAGNFGDMTERDRYIVFLANTNMYGDVTKMASSMFSADAMESIKTNPEKFYVVGHNVWAQGQEVMYMGAKDPKELGQLIRKNSENILNFFHTKEFKRVQSNLFARMEQFDKENELKEDHDIKLRIPEAYKLSNMNISRDSVVRATGVDGFEWMVFDGRKSMISIAISHEKYTDTSQLSVDAVIARRNSLGRYIPCGPDSSYIGTELDEPAVKPQQKVLDLNGNYAVETLGWWTCINAIQGGPFVNYAVIDKKRGRIIYLDGFVAAKGEPKKKYLIRLKSVLQTIDFD